jgi:adenylate kinase
MSKVVTVFGISGVGKSWVISHYAAAANVAHIQASQLMRDAKAAQVGQAVTSEDLRRGPVLDNQSLLTGAFAKVLATETRPIIFDGHCLIDAGLQHIEIPVDVISQLRPSGIVLMYAPTEEIVQRRNADGSRERPVRTPEVLTAQQNRCVELCLEYGKRLNVPFVQVRAGHELEFASVVDPMLQ